LNSLPESGEPQDLQLVVESLTLKIMTVVAFIFVPIVIAYKIWVYRILRARVTEDDVLKKSEAY
jgi:cytochrome d ubiquinol oxidase subunit II